MSFDWRRGFTCQGEADLMRGILCRYKPKTCVEIGRRFGISTHLIALEIKEWEGHLYSIDGVTNHHAIQRIIKEDLEDHITFIKGWSPWIAWSREIDFLYIDGDHNFMSALVDYHYWQVFVKTGGLILFHDTKFKPVSKAITYCKSRDNLKPIAGTEQLMIFEKTRPEREVYYQYRNHGFVL